MKSTFASFALCTILLLSVVSGFWTNLDTSSDSSDDEATTSTTTTTTTTTVTPSTDTDDESDASETSYTPSNDELCGCYQIDLVCPFVSSANRACYYYTMTRTSNASYCDSLQFLSLGTGNLTECGLNASYVGSVLVDYAPKCYAIDPTYNSSSGDGVPGIQIDFGDIDEAIYGSSSSSSSSDSDTDTLSSSSSSSEDWSVSDSGVADSGFLVFSVCFDAAAVDGTQENGEIEFQIGDNTATCSYSDTLPNFCGAEDDEATATLAPTTPAPTTSSPTTAVPTTSAPTTAAPTTSAPTTASPTTTSPTTASPTTASPSTAAPTTSPPTTAAPTTPSPTTPSPTTASPTTAEPTVAPTFDVCNSSDALNVAFILDESGSVDEGEWQVIKDFVDRVVQYDLSPLSYVSLFEYASLANYEQFLDWSPVEDGNGDRTAVTTALDTNNYNVAGQTETWDAVNRVLDNIWDYRYSCTDGCETRHDVMFLITDGEPTGTDVCPDMIARMNQTDIDVIVILIDPDGVLDETKVSCLDVQDGGKDVIKLEAFDTNAFNQIEAHLRNHTCSGEHPAGPGERPENGTQWRYNGTIGLGPIPTRDGGGQGGGADPLYVNGDVTDEDASWMEQSAVMGVSWMQLILGAAGLVVLLLLIGGVLYYIRKRADVKGMMVSTIDLGNGQDKDVEAAEGADSIAIQYEEYY